MMILHTIIFQKYNFYIKITVTNDNLVYDYKNEIVNWEYVFVIENTFV